MNLAPCRTSRPSVTVILPVRNEEKRIRTTLSAILNQDYPADLVEILCVDGCSSDKTRDVVQQVMAAYPGRRILLLNNPQMIVSAALNSALQRTTGNTIIRVDGHTVVAPDYIRRCVAELQRTGADNVGGRMCAIGDTPFGEAVAAATSSPFGVGGARFHYSASEELVDTVYLGAWRREAFQQIGGFDEELVRNQDDEFNYRLRAHGGSILLSPSIQSVYTARSTPSALWRQYFQYGLWKVRVLQKHPQQMQVRQFVPPAFTMALLGFGSLSLASPYARLALALVLTLYAAASLIASVLTASRSSWRLLPTLSVVFGILHLSYGLGFLAGLVKFAGRWRDRQGRVPNLFDANE